MVTIIMLALILGVVVPLLLIFVLFKGINRSPFSSRVKIKYKIKSVVYALVWASLVWVLGMTGIFSCHSGDILPRFVIPLFVPVFFGLRLIQKQNFRTIIDNTPLSVMVGMQAFRVMGVLFLLTVNVEWAPSGFVFGGYGDIITGLLALLAGFMLSKNAKGAKIVTSLFMVVGIADLLIVTFLLLALYPTWSAAQPSSMAFAEFPLILVLGLAAPFALTFHFYTFRRLISEVTIPSTININADIPIEALRKKPEEIILDSEEPFIGWKESGRFNGTNGLDI